MTDESGPPWWFKLAAGAMIAFVLVFVVLAIRAWRRTQVTKAYVATQGWTCRSRDRKLAARWTGPPFESGLDRRCEGVVEGRYAGWPFAAFLHRHDTGYGDDARDSWSIGNGDLLDLDNWNGRPEQITARLDYLIGVLQGIPDFVWQDRGGRPEQLKQGVS